MVMLDEENGRKRKMGKKERKDRGEHWQFVVLNATGNIEGRGLADAGKGGGGSNNNRANENPTN